MLIVFCLVRYHAHGILILNEKHVGADYTKLYFDGTHQSRDVVVDNVEAKFAPLECSELVINPSFQDASFWSYIDRGRSKVDLVTGVNGGSDLALRSFSRDHSWRGVRQQLGKQMRRNANTNTMRHTY